MNPEITPKLLKELIRYDPDTGQMFWKERPERLFNDIGSAFLWNTDNAGQEIFTKSNAQGYRWHSLFGTGLLGHRVAWAIEHGGWPDQLDHINGQKRDNRLCNLRVASMVVNQRNKVMSSANTSGHTGVHKTKSGKWAAKILHEHLGTFEEFEDAVKTRQEAQSETPGFTERHGLRKIGYAYLRKSRRAKKEYSVIRPL